jgi:hypothetical protein
LVGRRFGSTTVEVANGHLGQWTTGQTVFFAYQA